jgi:hypothetical protein
LLSHQNGEEMEARSEFKNWETDPKNCNWKHFLNILLWTSRTIILYYHNCTIVFSYLLPYNVSICWGRQLLSNL